MEFIGGVVPLVAGCGVIPLDSADVMIGIEKVSCTSRGGRYVRQDSMVIGVAKASSTSRGGHGVMLRRQGDCGAMPRGGGGGVMPPQEGDGAMPLGAAAARCRRALATTV